MEFGGGRSEVWDLKISKIKTQHSKLAARSLKLEAFSKIKPPILR
jgi:hypothetical protein